MLSVMPHRRATSRASGPRQGMCMSVLNLNSKKYGLGGGRGSCSQDLCVDHPIGQVRHLLSPEASLSVAETSLALRA
jgi:hypothetical protein